jgi:putative thioredoxin
LLKQLIEEYDGKIKLAKVEVDEGENMKLAGRYQVRGFPTILLINKGEEIARFSGAKPMSFLRNFVDENLANEEKLRS